MQNALTKLACGRIKEGIAVKKTGRIVQTLMIPIAKKPSNDEFK
jgi:hypothetical protein